MKFLVLTLLLASMSFAKEKTKPPLNPQEKIAHLYDRLTYGMKPSETDLWRGTNKDNVDRRIKKWLDVQLNPEKIKDSNVDSDLSYYPAAQMTSEQTRNRYKRLEEYAEEMGIKNIKEDGQKKELRQKIGEQNLPEAIVKEMVGQKILRAVRSKKQLQEVLVDFWMNHFNIDITKGEVKWMLPTFERESIRKHIFGHFDELLKATAHDPAMLYYLDNHLSRGPNKKKENGLNENYAREILELHTLGVDGGYTQKDVTELARILTGWSIADIKTNPSFEFKAKIHDHEGKHFLGKEFPAKMGQDEGERALDIIASHPSTARFISYKLARFFVSDSPPKALVDRLAKGFLQTHGDLKKLYYDLFTSREFWARDSYRQKIKKPSQFVFSAIRSLDGDVETKNDLPKILASMGEDLYKCAPPTGYKDIAEAWVNPGAMVYRLNFSLKLAANKIDGVYVQLPQINKNIHSPQKFIDQVSKKLMNQKLSPATEKVVLREFDPENHQMMDGEVRPFSLVKATGMILGSPEFQRR